AVVACSPREGSRGRPAAARGRRRLTGNTSESPRVVRRTSDRRRAEEWSFVLRALAVIHEIREEESGYGIAVLPEDEAQAASALEAHEAERAEPRAPLPEYGPSGAGWVFAAFILAVHPATGPRAEPVARFAKGRGDAQPPSPSVRAPRSSDFSGRGRIRISSRTCSDSARARSPRWRPDGSSCVRRRAPPGSPPWAPQRSPPSRSHGGSPCVASSRR